MSKVQMGRVGIWSMELRFGDPGAGAETAAELEELGYGALWIPGGIDDAVLGDVDRLLSATKSLAIGTGIINVWKQQPEDVASWWKGQSADRQARVMLGLGVSHAPLIGETWGKPLGLMGDYMDRLDAAGLPQWASCIAALGPKMLELAGRRTAGAHPYLVTPEHSAVAREVMGPGKLVAPEQGVVVETDAAKARELARGALDHYRFLPNYKNNWKRLGFTDDEIDNLSDRLIDGLFAWGSPAKIAERVKAHHDAGADHVCLQVVSGGDFDKTRAAYRELAAAVI
jgi:probable F420-dependent oxidoreductase